MTALPGPELMLTGFTLGLLGSGHCLAMCGGIASALGVRASTGASAGPLLALPLQAVGRLVSYAALGATAGAIGAVTVEMIPAAALSLRVVAGILMVAMGLYVAGLWRGLLALERLGRAPFAVARTLAGHARGPAEPLAFGLAWGLLPCGLVYSTVAWSLAAGGSAPGGALLMVAFGLGTVPATSGATLLAAPLGDVLRAPRTRRLAGLTIIAFGLWTLLAGGALLASASVTSTASARDDAVATLDCHDAAGTRGFAREEL